MKILSVIPWHLREQLDISPKTPPDPPQSHLRSQVDPRFGRSKCTLRSFTLTTAHFGWRVTSENAQLNDAPLTRRGNPLPSPPGATRRSKSGHEKGSPMCDSMREPKHATRLPSRVSFYGHQAPLDRWLRPLRGDGRHTRSGLGRSAAALRLSGRFPGRVSTGKPAGQGLKRARDGAANRQGIAQDTMRHTGMKQTFIPV